MLNKSRCHPESRRIIRTATKKCRKKSTLAGSLRYETTGVAQASALPDYIYLLTLRVQRDYTNNLYYGNARGILTKPSSSLKIPITFIFLFVFIKVC
jgi:hypothetical protein